MDKTWLYHYDPETKQQSVEWQHSGSPRPKKFQVQKSTEKVLASVFWIKMASSSFWLSSKRPNCQRGVLLIPAAAIEGHFEGKTRAMGRSPRESRSCMTMPWLTGQLQSGRNWPTCASSVLMTHPILRIWPNQTTTCSLDWKNNWQVAIFHPMWRSLLPWRSGWMDNLLNFFLVACKGRAMG